MTGAGKRTLVVGGGLIGTEVALRLRESGGDVRVLSRTIGSRLRALAPAAGIELVEAELGTGLKLSSAIADVDAIVCLAGSSTPSRAAADPAGALSGSVMPALDALLAAARRRGRSASSSPPPAGRSTAPARRGRRPRTHRATRAPCTG